MAGWRVDTQGPLCREAWGKLRQCLGVGEGSGSGHQPETGIEEMTLPCRCSSVKRARELGATGGKGNRKGQREEKSPAFSWRLSEDRVLLVEGSQWAGVRSEPWRISFKGS